MLKEKDVDPNNPEDIQTMIEEIQEYCEEFLTLENVKKALPKYTPAIEKVERVVSAKRINEDKIDDAEKFALGVKTYDVENQILIGLGLKGLEKGTGKIVVTNKGLQMAMAIRNALYEKKKPNNDKVKKIKARKKEKARRKASKK